MKLIISVLLLVLCTTSMSFNYSPTLSPEDFKKLLDSIPSQRLPSHWSDVFVYSPRILLPSHHRLYSDLPQKHLVRYTSIEDKEMIIELEKYLNRLKADSEKLNIN
ncbi:uncharacterized protein LOC114333131 [Diabrotica virgifera virgifera]|uniref:Uncharacterized protein LOC114333131 n=1 Tax=Diabrotica virgifera virgifera TaxID=50390 RepID=A0A6P7FR68_DIAVI|nr:uncharacterized protein LOC114333131 [Diabrotica virgifera virgifera]